MTIECYPIQPGPAGREEWLSWRKRDITASRVGALFGYDMPGNTTVLRLWAEQRGTEFPDQPDNKMMKRGRKLEQMVGEEVAEQRPEWSIKPMTSYYRDSDLRLGATPDFEIFNDPRGRGILQAKTTNPAVLAKHWDQGRVPPDWVELQIRTEMLLTDAAFGIIAVLVVGPYEWATHIIDVERSKAVEDTLIVAVRRFWDDVATGTEPAPDFLRDADVIRALRPHETPGLMCDLSGNNEIGELLEARATMMESIKAFETRCEAVETELKYLMGKAEQVTGLLGWRITYKTTEVKEYIVKARKSRVLRIYDKRKDQGQ